MFGRPKAPIDDEMRLWLDQSMAWLLSEFGSSAARDRPVVVPTGEFFPDAYDGSDEALELLVDRVSAYMLVDRDRFELQIFSDDDTGILETLPGYQSSHQGAAGIFVDPQDGKRLILGLEEAQLDDAAAVVATTAHELAHIHLLADNRIKSDDPMHEPLTDLLTVFMGLGVFTANAAFRFEQWEDGGWQGWSANRSGYLEEGQLGYALALHALIRGESKPKWASYLGANIAPLFKKSVKFLARNPPPFIQGHLP